MASPELIKSTIEALLKPVEDTIKTLFGPAAEEVGLFFADSVRLWRLRNQVRLFRKFQTDRAELGITAKAIKPMLLFEILDGAALEDDENLQEIWSNLLLNASDSREEVLVKTAFPQMLRQISRKEVLYLNEMFEIMQQAEVHMVKTYDMDIEDHTPKLDRISYDNLERLRLIDPNPETIPAAAVTPSADEMKKANSRYKFLTQETYTLTALGEAFVQACRTPRNQQSDAGKVRNQHNI